MYIVETETVYYINTVYIISFVRILISYYTCFVTSFLIGYYSLISVC